MADRDMTMVFCYDISSPTLRRRVAEALEKRAARVQLSVFEARMTGQAAERLFRRLEKFLEPGDSLRMYALSKAGLARCKAAGGAPIPEGENYWLL